VRQLEKDLKLQSEVSERLQKETEDLKAQLIKEKSRPTAPSKVTLDAIKKKAPMLAKSADGKVNNWDIKLKCFITLNYIFSL